jgi:hypothetical protein
MAYTTIDDPTIYFNTILYTGNGSQRNITGVGFQPDWIWGKNRSATGSHNFVDSVRGVSKVLYANLNDAEATDTSSFNAFGSDGFSVGSQSNVNGNGNSIVAWNWKAGGSASSNSDGSITSSVSANTTAGFSIVSYTGTGSAATVGHGLGVAPSLYIVKNRSSGAAWRVFVSSLGADKILRLSTTHASSTDTGMWNNTLPTSSVFSIGTPAQVNTSGENYIAYCFAEKKGYSKFGSYSGNGNVDGTFVYTGFKPSFLLIKITNSADSWRLFDNKRTTTLFNPIDITLRPNTSDGDYTASANNVDFLSNGFKMRTTSGGYNGSSDEIIFMAFAENPFVTSSGVPACAK